VGANAPAVVPINPPLSGDDLGHGDLADDDGSSIVP